MIFTPVLAEMFTPVEKEGKATLHAILVKLSLTNIFQKQYMTAYSQYHCLVHCDHSLN